MGKNLDEGNKHDTEEEKTVMERNVCSNYIEGLIYVTNWISSDDELNILYGLDKFKWSNDLKRRYGGVQCGMFTMTIFHIIPLNSSLKEI